MRTVVICALCCLALLGPLTAVATAQVTAPGHDPLAGSQVFGAKGCVKCHSVNGAGGKVGPDLARIARAHSFYDLATAMWNHLPRMADRMRQLGIARPNLTTEEAGNLVAFLYTLNYFEPPGNPDTGKRLFGEKRCIVCHQINGVGGVVGPNLDAIGREGSPIAVAAAMWNHGPAMVEVMRAKGVARPSFTGGELRDLLAYLVPAATAMPSGPVYALPGRVDTGRRLFIERRCIECHSVAGQGGRVGPDLVERGVRRSLLEFAAAMWNKAPAMLAAMQPRGITVPQLQAGEMADIIGYLYSVRYFAGPGDVRRGWTVATDKGCLRCHGLYGERGKPASDLARAPRLDPPPAVLAALWNHAIVTAQTPSGEKAPWPELGPEEMADLVAALGSLGRRP
jgi:cytochrome c2